MAITQEVEMVAVDWNDRYEVILWTREQTTELTVEQAEALAEELLRTLQQVHAQIADEQVQLASDARVAQLISDVDNGIETITINGTEREL